MFEFGKSKERRTAGWRWRWLAPLAVALALTAAACGGDEDEPGATDGTTGAASPTATATATASPTASPTATATGTAGDAIEIEAEDLSFDTDTVTVSAGSTVMIDFKSRDEVPHNFAVYEDESATTEIFSGELLTGPDAETVYEFTAPSEAGTYFFRCDVHPEEMTGDFIVQ